MSRAVLVERIVTCVNIVVEKGRASRHDYLVATVGCSSYYSFQSKEIVMSSSINISYFLKICIQYRVLETNAASDSIMFFAKLCSVAAAEHITNQLLA